MSAASLMHLDVRDLANMSLDDAADWPVPVKVACVLLVFLSVLLLGYVVSVRGLNADYRQQRQLREVLLKRLEQRSAEARDPVACRQRLAALEQQFGTLTRQLPKVAGMSALLEDISRIGRTAGLEFHNIALQDEKGGGFYAVLPIRIEVLGSYHAFGAFVSGIAALPRIVTLHDFVIKPAKNEVPQGPLMMTLTARAYRDLGVDADERGMEMAAGIEAPPPFHPVAAFAYRAQALRSPFTAVGGRQAPLEAGNRSGLPAINRPAEYLERFALDSLTLVGTITRQEAPPEALIEDPTGLVTRVRRGSHLGKAGGRVEAVSPGRVDVVETTANERGKRVVRSRSLFLGGTSREHSPTRDVR